MRPDGRTDITKLIVAFHSLAKAPNPALRTIASDVLWLLALCIRVCNARSDRRLLLFSV